MAARKGTAKATETPEVDEAMLEAFVEELRTKVSEGEVDPREVIQSTEKVGSTTLSTLELDPDPSQRNNVTLYNTITGTPSVVRVSALKAVIKKRWPRNSYVPRSMEGKRVFSEVPVETRKFGSIKCSLNAESPDRKIFDEASPGLPFCQKANIPSILAKENHMRSKHGREYKLLQDFQSGARADATAAREEEKLDAIMKLAEAMIESKDN